MARRKVTTPKSFFRAERDRFYDDSTEAFWRELFQNACDPGAGARNVAITIGSHPMRGSFDEAAAEDRNVTRIVFSDDGNGMTKDVLNDVYFSLGETTKKDGDSTGGFGRARLMTCFANTRFSILTNDRFVSGDGPDFENWDLDEAVEAANAAISGLEDQPGGTLRDAAIAGLRGDVSIVTAARAAGGFKGCRVEVDMDPEDGEYSYRRPTLDRMTSKLRSYLSESQLPCKVTINGLDPEAFFGSDEKITSRRGPVRQRLVANIEGRQVEFASIHLSEGSKAAHKGKVIVRVDGAAMFTNATRAGTQVIVEVDKGVSRDAMTSNRDSFRNEYKAALEAFLALLAVDDKSALKDKADKGKIHIAGSQGRIRARAPSKRLDLKAMPSVDELEGLRVTVSAAPSVASGLEMRRFGVPEEVLREFVGSVNRGESFVDGHGDFGDDQEKAREIRNHLRYRHTYEGDDPVKALEGMSDASKSWLVSMLLHRYRAAQAEEARENEERLLRDMNDVYIVLDSTNPKTRAAAKRNDPRNWDETTGKGRRPRALLVAWTAACSVAVEALMKIRPATDAFEYSTGFIYSVPEKKDAGDTYRMGFTEAAHTKEGDTHYFLLNPVTETGELHLNPAKASDRQKLVALAIHEVGHVLESWHNESFAGIQTDLLSEIDLREATRRMTRATTAVYAAYEAGRARVQAMDSDEGPRPAERLLAAGYAGRDVAGAFEPREDGTSEVDCDRLLDLAPKPRMDEDDAPRMCA